MKDATPLTDENLSVNETAKNANSEKFVVFFLDDELFAVSANRVAEVVGALSFTALPNSPAWLHGIANLRGSIVSVLAISRLFQKKSPFASSKNKFVVLKSDNLASPVGFPVDRLSEMIALTREDIKPADDPRLTGQTTYEEKSVKLLDTDKIFASLQIS